jgi:hypothetical protein
MASTNPIRARARGVLLIVSILALAACTSTATTLAPSAAAEIPTRAAPSPSASASAAAPDSPEPSAESSVEATAEPTSIDPCQLISADEAGNLAGTTFKAGKETTTSGNGRICTYGSATLNIFSVEVAIAPDEATAKADEAAFQADLDASASKLAGQNVTVTQLPGFAPGTDAALLAATVSLGGKTLGMRGMYVLRGTTFFSFSDVAFNKAPPSADAMTSEAMTVLGRLP